MSVVIIGGNERMEQQYKEICKRYRCKAKVFTRMSGNLKTQIGQPDLIILIYFYGGPQDGPLRPPGSAAL